MTVPVRDYSCQKHPDHSFEKDEAGVEVCSKCGTTWKDAVRGVGIGGDLPARNRSLSDKMNREAGIG